jgi:hypothetical protein
LIVPVLVVYLKSSHFALCFSFLCFSLVSLHTSHFALFFSFMPLPPRHPPNLPFPFYSYQPTPPGICCGRPLVSHKPIIEKLHTRIESSTEPI